MNFFWKWLGGNTYDIFVGEGWDNWTRVNVSRHGVHHVAGLRLSTSLAKDIHTSIIN